MGSGRGLRRTLAAVGAGMLAVTMMGVVTGQSASATTCDNAPLAGAPTIRVLVVGDSLTISSAGDWSWRYRYWKQQRDLGVNVDFVGPFTGMMPTVDHNVSMNQAYADPCFTEREHFAYGGWKLAGVLDDVSWAVSAYDPDVVVEFLGGNDLAAGATPSEVTALAHDFVSEVRRADPTTDVLTVTSPEEGLAPVAAFNALLLDQAPRWSTAASSVAVADVTRDWQGTADTWDGIHGNARGEMHLAWDIGDGLAGLGWGATPSRPIPTVLIGPRVAPVLSLRQETSSSVTLAWTGPIGADREAVWLQDLTAGTGWVKMRTVLFADGNGTTLTGLSAHRYAIALQAAKGTAVAEGLFSATLDADLRPGRVLARTTITGASARLHRVALAWNSVPGASSYRVRWRPVGATAWSTKDVSTAGTVVTGLTAGLRYAFRVTARRAGVLGEESAEVRRTPAGVVTAAPARPQVGVVSGHRFRVSWTGVRSATRYRVQVRTMEGAWRTVGWTTRTRFTTAALVRGRIYEVRVRPYDGYVAGRVSAARRARMR